MLLWILPKMNPDVNSAVNPAVNAVVNPAVNSAVNPAVNSPLTESRCESYREVCGESCYEFHTNSTVNPPLCESCCKLGCDSYCEFRSK